MGFKTAVAALAVAVWVLKPLDGLIRFETAERFNRFLAVSSSGLPGLLDYIYCGVNKFKPTTTIKTKDIRELITYHNATIADTNKILN